MATQYGRVPWEIFAVDGALHETEIEGFAQFVYDPMRGRCRRSFAHEVSFVNGKELCPDVAGDIWSILKPYVPGELCEGPVDYVMYAVVEAGQGFPMHVDAGCVYDTVRGKFSGFTVIVYLTEFEGGALDFYSEAFEHIAHVCPKKGRIVCFDIGLYHAAAPVTRGTKAWLGTELIILTKQSHLLNRSPAMPPRNLGCSYVWKKT